MADHASSLVIRPARAEDCPAIVELMWGLAQFEKLTHIFHATPELLHEHLFGRRPYAEVLLAEWEGKPAGFALFFHNYSTFLCRPGLYLEDVYVVPELRSKGIGKAIMVKLAQIAVERGCGRFEWTVLDWNTKAMDLYKRLGAVAMDEWKIFRMSGEALKNFAEGKV
ncbi:MAG: GNAT family N-acetyltransferase [bacterium]